MNNNHQSHHNKSNINTNTQYVNTSNNKHILIVDVKGTSDNNSNLTKDGTFSIKLPQTLRLDKPCEVFLDSFITFNGDVVDTTEKSAFLLKIDQFNIRTHGASDENVDASGRIINDKYQGAIVIPNENRDVDNYLTTTTHKSKKLNYVCDMKSKHIHHISGSITNLKGDPIFASRDKTNNKVYTLLNITTSNSPEWSKRKNKTGGVELTPLDSHEKYFIQSGFNINVYNLGTSLPNPETEDDSGVISNSNYTKILSGHAACNINKDSSIIYMTSSPIKESILYGNTPDTFFLIELVSNATDGIIKYPGHTGDIESQYIYTKNITILESECRFIAEFNLIEQS